MLKKMIMMAVFISGLLIVMGSQANRLQDESETVEIECIEQVINGIVIDATMNTLTIKVSDGNQIMLITSEADKSLAQGLIIGSHVEVTYEGNLYSDDELNIKVKKIKLGQHSQESGSYDLVSQLLNEMTLEEKVGQVFFVRCPEPERVKQVLSLNPGGLLLFGRDFKGKEKEIVKSDIQNYQDLSHFPLIIGVDEEGGTVNRVSSNSALAPKPFESPSALFAKGGNEGVLEDAKIKGKLLLDLGINVNLAPVADISKSESDFIHDRTVGLDAKGTSLYVQSVVAGMKEVGISGTLKHFPGYGNNVDTHTEFARDTRGYDEFLTSDFMPFQAGIEAGVESVLVSHVVVECLDESLPASLSQPVHEVLRNELHFKGVIMTDDLTMDAISGFKTDIPVEVLAFNAGNDLLIVTDFESSYNVLLDGVQSGQVSEGVLDDAVRNVLKWKIEMGLLPVGK